MRRPGVAQAAVIAREDEPGSTRLVGYVVGSGADGALDAVELRAQLAQRLPDYMVPAAILILAGPLPLTPNGKLDRPALPAPDFTALTGVEEPRTAVEHTLAQLFAETLRLPRVGVHDDFFGLGGDSIVAIGLVGGARRRGLVLRPRDVFERRTVAGLAAVAQERAAPRVADPALGLGRVAPTPIMHWLRELGGDIAGFYQSLLLQAPDGLDRVRLEAVVQAVLDRHDLLRARLRRDDGWTLEVPAAGSAVAADVVEVVELGDGDLAAAIASQRVRLDPDGGRMVQVVWFDAGPSRPGRVHVLVHHTVVDGVSLRILIGDLATAWAAVAGGSRPRLDEVGTPFRRWSQLLSQQGRGGARAAERELWQVAAAAADPLLGARALDQDRDLVGGSQTLTVTLAAEETTTLLATLPALYGATVNDVLLTALAVAVARWRSERGRGDAVQVVVDLEGHGREDVFDDVDLARTIGWFTTLFPVLLDPGVVEWDWFARGGPAAGDALRRIKDQLRALPDRGLGFGILRDLDPAGGLADARKPQLLFNYLGRFAVSGDAPWTPAPEAPPLGDERDPGMPMGHALKLDAVVRDGDEGPRLSAVFTWPGELFGADEIGALARLWDEALRGLHAHAAQPGAGGHTPSDFPFVTLDQAEVDEFEAVVPALEDVLPATALQEGFFFHALADEAAQDVYIVQQRIELTGPLDAGALRAALDALVTRHAPLRAGFQQRADGSAWSSSAADSSCRGARSTCAATGLQPMRVCRATSRRARTRSRSKRARSASTSAARRCCAAR